MKKILHTSSVAIVTGILNYAVTMYWVVNNRATTLLTEFGPLLIIPVLIVALRQGKRVRSEILIGLGIGYGISTLALGLSLVLFIAAWNAAV